MNKPFELVDGRKELWQWDTNRYIYAPDCQQVHYSQLGGILAVAVVNGLAAVPNEMLQKPAGIRIMAYVTVAGNYTTCKKHFNVIARPKPPDYIYTPTEVLSYETLRREIGNLADLVTQDKSSLVAAINEAYGSGGTGTRNYNELFNQPAVNGVTLQGDKSAEDLSLQDEITDLEKIRNGAEAGATAYQKPNSGIPAADLAEAVRSSLAKADTALQEVPETYRTAAEQDEIDNDKVDKETGKGLSTNDFTTEEKTKLAGLSNYDDTDVKDRLDAIEEQESGWDAKQDAIADLATIRSNASAGAGIVDKVSAQASSTNKLVSASEMGDAIASVEAKQLYATNAQGSFATKADLTSATTFYNADGTVATPTKNDVAYVLSDESRDGKSTKYVVASVSPLVWGFVISFSSFSFTQAQMDAINSNITNAKRQGYDSHVADESIHVTEEEKEAWDAKQNAINDLATIRSGAAAGATAVQPAAIADMATKQWVEGKGYLTEHQSLAAYRTSAAQDTIDAGKQPTISDLATIRSGAAAGATAVQPSALNAYYTKTQTDAAIAAAIGDAIGGEY